MNGIRFYAEFPEGVSKRRPVAEATNVVALFAGSYTIRDGEAILEGLGSLYDRPNSPVASTGISAGFLRSKCKRISEAKAREIHPALFARLDESDD